MTSNLSDVVSDLFKQAVMSVSRDTIAMAIMRDYSKRGEQLTYDQIMAIMERFENMSIDITVDIPDSIESEANNDRRISD